MSRRVVSDFLSVAAAGLAGLGAACVMFLLLLGVVVLSSGTARAAGDPFPKSAWCFNAFSCDPVRPSPDAVGDYRCNVEKQPPWASGGAICSSFTVEYVSATQYWFNYYDSANPPNYYYHAGPIYKVSGGTCPANSTDTGGGNCTCSGSYTPTGTQQPSGYTTYTCESPPPDCQANATWNGTACVCNQGYNAVGEYCDPPCSSLGGIGGITYGGTGMAPSWVCIDRCKYLFADSISAGSGAWWQGTTLNSAMGPNETCNAANGTVGGGGGTATVENSTDNSAPPDDPANYLCPRGYARVVVGGVALCKVVSEVGGTQTTTIATGEVTKDASGVVTGSKEITTTRTATGEGVATTVVTVTKDAAGNVTGSTETTSKDDVNDFCKLNPTASICKKSSWGGACGAFACEGDAVQCAIAREIHQRNCQLHDTTNEETDLYAAIKAGNDPQKGNFPNDPSQLETKSFAGSISQATFLSGGAGLADFTFEVQGQTITVPMSRWNDILAMCGIIVVAFSLIVAARIVAEGA